MLTQLKSVVSRHADTLVEDMLGMTAITLLFVVLLHLPILL
ncbi:hypothetical protein [Haematobacter missouriensis]|uniref:Uncharacterized protein n=1 Tax=Haematobacter missouriensis TaxID=366616 RepID=A0A225CU29_9RHOB|nr:hypothetical protein [Haematobacter missouriensis]OWJ72348.1 hypothetical protein CDV53_17260 [Haematobacter missouriensis]OWJ86197.1 hypothetical protein CDV52_03370 [Haematobacter missouriensis]